MDKIASTRYPSEVFWSDEDEGFIALAPDLPGCSAFGDTQAEALRELEDAISAWMQAAEAVGNPIPLPSPRRPPSEYSGKFIVRIAKQLHASLAKQAAEQGVSLNHYVAEALAAASREQQVLHFAELLKNAQQATTAAVHNIAVLSAASLKFSELRAFEFGSSQGTYAGSMAKVPPWIRADIPKLLSVGHSERNTIDFAEEVGHG